MKTISKILLVAMTLFIVNSSSLFAKGNSSDGMLFGFDAGVNFANVGDLPAGSPSFSMLVGYHVGVFIDMGIADNLYFQPGVRYSLIGAKDNSTSVQDFGGGPVTVTDNINLNLGYIQIPLNFSYRLESGLNFNIDPYIGINLSAKESGTESAAGMSVSVSNDLKNPPAGRPSNFNSFDYGFGFGVGYMLSSGLGFNAAYTLGLAKDIKEDDSTTPSTPSAYTNNVISVTVSYELGKK